MKKQFMVLAGLLLTFSMATTGCGGTSGTTRSGEQEAAASEAVSEQGATASEQAGEQESSASERASEQGAATSEQVSEQESAASEQEDSSPETEENDLETDAAELTVRFGTGGEAFAMHLEENSTAAAIADYVGTSSWNLPIYSYDESDVMEYYDIPSRYDIPDNSETVTQAHAGDVFYSDPNRIVLYYADAEIDEEYTLIGTFDATDEFVDAVVNNPVLEGWGNQIVVISDGE